MMLPKTLYDKLFNKVNDSDTKIPGTIGLVTKAQFHSDKQGLEKKIQDVDNTSGLIKKTACRTKSRDSKASAKATEMEGKVPNTAVFITTLEFNRLEKLVFDARIKEVTKSLASKSQLDAALDTSDKNRKNEKTSNA